MVFLWDLGLYKDNFATYDRFEKLAVFAL